MKTYNLLFTLAVLLLPRWSGAQGNLIINGGFDTDASGWTTNISSGFFQSSKGNPGGVFTLLGTISQTVNGLNPGSSYLISGNYEVEGGALGNTLNFTVAIDSISLFQAAPLDHQWDDFSFSYTASSPSAVLSLTADGANAYRIDNISMELIPEPSTLSMFSIFILLFCRWRKQNA
jgi:hypothetical protein